MSKKALLLLLLAFGLAFPTLRCVEDATGIILGPASGVTGLMLAVIGMTAVLIAVAYMIGTALGNANYVVFAKDESYHLVFSLLLLTGFGTVMLLTCSTIDSFYTSTFQAFKDNSMLTSTCFNPTNTLQGVAKCYMKTAQKDATSISNEYVKQYVKQQMDSTWTWSIQLPLVNSYTSSAGAFRRILSNQYDMMLNAFAIPALMSISMQKLALGFIQENIVNWVLPMAFVLRIFIPTRQMGNMLIALVLALYVLVPFMYAFNFAMYEVLLTPTDCAAVENYVCDFALDTSGGGDCTTACENQFGLWRLARLMPQAFFLPNLMISIVITFLSAIHRALRVIG